MALSNNNQIRKFRVYRKRQFKFDFIAAIVVFLVAIPLCLGIALASGAPLFSGILSGIVGGIVVGTLSGSHVSVSGPAAGMAAVVIAAITQLGDFNTFLLALLIAGVLQVAVGILRAGFIAEYIPSNVIQGLLCAIGLLLIIKQLPLAFTLSSDFAELKKNLMETTSDGVHLYPIYDLKNHINTGATLISLVSFAVLIFFNRTKISFLRVIPGPIVVVVLGIVLNEMFVFINSSMAQNSPQLVNIPLSGGFKDFLSHLQTPTWSAWTNPKIYLYAFILATVASLESLLNIKASEKLDKKRRYCSKDQELVAQGCGNMLAALIGGLPVTSVIVRTSVNIQSGAKTKLSAIIHGFLILFSVMIIPGALNKIPLSSLAAILIYTGYKLTNPQIYKDIFKQGLERFIPFIVTIICIVTYNLLAGIVIGLIVSLFYILKTNGQARLDIIKEKYPTTTINRLMLPQQTTFLNKASLVAELATIPRNSQLIIDARQADFVDKEIIEFIKDYKEDQAPHKQISLNLIGFKDHYDIHDYIDFINVTTYDVQSQLEPEKVLNVLKEGNQRFLDDSRIHRSMSHDLKQTADTQHPIAVVLGCIDSRVPAETVFDMSMGDLFCIRIAGNVINDDILASMEYACHVVGAKLLVVLGHTQCGAIKAACDDVKEGHITKLLSKIKPAIDGETYTSINRSSHNKDFVNNVTHLNVAQTLQKVYDESNILKQMTDEHQIGLVGAIYDVNSGVVSFKDYSKEILMLEPKKGEPLANNLQQLIEAAKQEKESH